MSELIKIWIEIDDCGDCPDCDHNMECQELGIEIPYIEKVDKCLIPVNCPRHLKEKK